MTIPAGPEHFRINLPDGNWAEVHHDDDGFAVWISGPDYPAAYRSAWRLSTFADAARNIMDVVWAAASPFSAGDSQ